MKKIKIVLLIALISLTKFSVAVAQEKSREFNYTKKVIIGPDQMIMWGMVNYGDTMLVDETETLIYEWLEFIYFNDLKEFPSYLMQSKLSNEEIFKLIEMDLDPKLFPINPISRSILFSLLICPEDNCDISKFRLAGANYYFPMHPDSVASKQKLAGIEDKLKMPITGITYEQALLYCAWRTTRDSIRITDDRYRHSRKNKFYYHYYTYELPTQVDYGFLIANRDSTSADENYSTFNYRNALAPKKPELPIVMKKYGKFLLSTGAYLSHRSKNEYLLDIQGNAAEMTNIKGISFGGSYMHYANQSTNKTPIFYDNPEIWLGFRCCAKKRK